MPKKKKIEIVEEPAVTATSVPEMAVPPDPAEALVSVIANGSFHDGAFKHDFEKLGYKVHWADQEVREIPARLYAKLMKRSGGKFSLKG